LKINYDTITHEISEYPSKFYHFSKLHKLRITRNSSVWNRNEIRLKPI